LNFCGPKCSYCCLVVSVWGIIMLLILGILFSSKARALIRDAPDNSVSGMNTAAMSCYIAAGIYVVTTLISVWQIRLNNQAAARLHES